MTLQSSTRIRVLSPSVENIARERAIRMRHRYHQLSLYYKLNHTRILQLVIGDKHRLRHHLQSFASSLYKTIRFQVAMGLSSNRSRRHQNLVRTSVTHLAASRVPLFCSDVICDLLLNSCTLPWNLKMDM